MKIDLVSKNDYGYIIKHDPISGADPLMKLGRYVRRVRASGAKPLCTTTTYLKMLGYRGSVDAQSQRRFDVGSMMEPVVARWMMEDGCEVEHNDSDSTCVLIPVKGGVITGHHDVIYSHPVLTNGFKTLGDIKTMNDRNYKDWVEKGTAESKPGYYAQVSLYAPLFDLRYGSIIATSKNTQEYASDLFGINLEYREDLIKSIEEIVDQESYFKDRAGPETRFGSKTLCDYCENRTECVQGQIKPEEWCNNVPKLVEGRLIDVLAHIYEVYWRGRRVEPRYSLDECIDRPAPESFGAPKESALTF